MLIRHADPERDAAACQAIYAPLVTGSPVSFEEAPPSTAEFAQRIARHSRTHAFLVAEDDEVGGASGAGAGASGAGGAGAGASGAGAGAGASGAGGAGGTVAGFAYASPHRARAAYRWTAETSVYLRADYRGRGVGTSLYERLLGLLRTQGMRTALGGVTLPNDASIALHRRCGFVQIAVFPNVGWKDGAWRDVAWLVCDLNPAAAHEPGPPPEPGPPARLDRPRRI